MSRPGASAGSAAAAPGTAVDAVVTHHVDGFRSGVARFNEVLAERLGVPMLGLGDLARADPACPLLSFKVSELGAAAPTVEAAVATGLREWELYLHEYRGLPLERQLVAGARRVHCGNAEILAAVRELAPGAQVIGTPGLILDDRVFQPVEVSVFSFGMAHKVQVGAFRRLKQLLDTSGATYAVYVSAANHETASLRDSEAVFVEMHDIFPRELYFLGNLSDVAVFNYLTTATFFAAFFERGVRANNTSVASALERGAVVITNLDEYSPPEYVHMGNVIDVARCDALPLDPVVLEGIGRRAAEAGCSRGWDAFLKQMR